MKKANLIFLTVILIVVFCACNDSSCENIWHYADENIYDDAFFDNIVVGKTTYSDLFGKSILVLEFGSEVSTGYFRTETKIIKIDFKGKEMVVDSIKVVGER